MYMVRGKYLYVISLYKVWYIGYQSLVHWLSKSGTLVINTIVLLVPILLGLSCPIGTYTSFFTGGSLEVSATSPR